MEKKELTEEESLKLGFEIENELKSLFESGIISIGFMDLKGKAPLTYEELYELVADAYHDEDKSPSGIKTSHYSIIQDGTVGETEEENFKISKND